MRKSILIAAAMSVTLAVHSQTVLYQDDFESYELGSYLGISNPEWWTTWSNLPGSGEDMMVTNYNADSGTKSAFISLEDGVTDALLKLGDKTSGVYELEWSMLVEDTYAAYYNLQHFESPGIEWAFEIYFNLDGNGVLNVGNESYSFSFPHSSWFSINHLFNIDEDQATLFIDNQLIHKWPLHYEVAGTEGSNQLGAINFNDASGFRYMIDDVKYKMIPTESYQENFESYSSGAYMAVSNSYWWSTWSNLPGTGEDVVVSDAYSSSGSYSAFITWEDGITDALLLLGDKTSGAYELNWKIYVESGFGAYYNLQHFESPGVEFAFEVYFNINGTGELRVGNSSYFFSFNHDTWTSVNHIFNLDADQAILSVDGVEVHQWPFHYNTWSTEGTNQLGAVDFNDGINFRSYIDDIEYDSLDLTNIRTNNNNSRDISFSVYPNPAINYVSIASAEEINELEVLDQVGRTIYKREVENKFQDLDISDFSKGVYFIRAKSETGMTSRKLVVK